MVCFIDFKDDNSLYYISSKKWEFLVIRVYFEQLILDIYIYIYFISNLKNSNIENIIGKNQ